jgi:Mrp family chromosome partitioning ATPase
MSFKRHQCLHKDKILPSVKNIVAISSGKGGVGKSTLSFAIARIAHRLGLSVGLLDADIYGPSLNHLSGITEKVQTQDKGLLVPHLCAGMPIISIAHLVDAHQALAWRGPMASGALMQLFSQTQWPHLDLLFIDMPPGTGDLHLTLCQKIPLTAAVLITTDHQLSAQDYTRGKSLYEKLHVPLLGTIRNLSRSSKNELQEHHDLLGALEFSEELYSLNADSSFFFNESETYQKLENITKKLLANLQRLPLFQEIPFKIK